MKQSNNFSSNISNDKPFTPQPSNDIVSIQQNKAILEFENNKLTDFDSWYTPDVVRDNRNLADHNKYEQALIVIGQTKGGKSTIINGLINPDNLVVENYVEDPDDKDDKGKYVIDVKNKSINEIKIGHALESETSKVYEYFDQSTQTKYIDLPGFEDNRTEYDLPNAEIIKNTFQNLSNIRILLVIEYNDLTSLKRFRDVVHSIKHLFIDVSKVKTATGLIITKVLPDSYNNVRGAISKLKTRFSDDKDIKELLQYFLDEKKIAIFRAPTEISQREITNIKESIKEIINIQKNLDVFATNTNNQMKYGFAITSTTELKIIKEVQSIEQKIIKAFEGYSNGIITNTKNYLKEVTNYKDLKKYKYYLEKKLEKIIDSKDYSQLQQDLKKLDKALSNELEPCFKRLLNIEHDFPGIYYSQNAWTKSLSKVIELLQSIFELEKAYLKDSYMYQVKGVVLSAEHVLEQVRSIKTQESTIKAIQLYSANSIFIDTNFNEDLLKGINISIISPYWKIESKYEIDISGRNGKSHPLAKAKNGDELNRGDRNKDGSGKKGNDGGDGLPGNPGENGGNFIGIGDKFIGLENLTINVSGGEGGPGQEGGDGSQGTKSKVHGNRQAVENREQSCLISTDIMPGIRIRLLEKYESKGLSGGVGGIAGKGGDGGIGGYAGQISFKPAAANTFPNIIEKQFLKGNHGLHGKAGKGEENGKIYYGEYVNQNIEAITLLKESLRGGVSGFAATLAEGMFLKVFFSRYGPLGEITKLSINQIRVLYSVAGAGGSAVDVLTSSEKTFWNFIKSGIMHGASYITANAIDNALLSAAALSVIPGPLVSVAVFAGTGMVANIVREIGSSYVNSGWQGSIEEKESFADDGKVPTTFNTEKMDKPVARDYDANSNLKEVLLAFKEYVEKSKTKGLGGFIPDEVDVILHDNGLSEVIIPSNPVKQAFEILDSKANSSFDKEDNIAIITINHSLQGPKYNAFNMRNNPSYWYQAADIKIIQQELLYQYLDLFYINEPVGGNQTIDQLLKEMIFSMMIEKPALLIFNQNNVHWISVAIAKTNKEIIVLKKDSRPNNDQDKVLHFLSVSDDNQEEPKWILKDEALSEEELVQEVFSFNLINNGSVEQYDSVNCGIFALCNAQIMAERMSVNQDDFIEKFKIFDQFCDSKKAALLRSEDFANYYLIGTYKEIISEHKKHDLRIEIRESYQDKVINLSNLLNQLFADYISKGEIKHILSLKSYETVSCKKKTLYTKNELGCKVERDISQTIAVELIISELNQETQQYTYGYKISWTIDLEWGGKIDYKQIQQFLIQHEEFSDIKYDNINNFIYVAPLDYTASYQEPLKSRLPTFDELVETLCVDHDNKEDVEYIKSILGNNHLECFE